MNRDFTSYPFNAKRYNGIVPPLTGCTDLRQHTVAIVGGGPVGLTAALALARHGVRSILIEADDSVCTGSRAICISRRSLEIFKRLGVESGFLAKGLPWAGGRSFYRDTEVFQFQMHQDDEQSLPPMINIAQYQIEQTLLDEVEQHADMVEILWQTRVTAVKQYATGATLALQTNGQGWVLNADWIIACDGGRSTMREALGLTLTGTSYEGRYVIADIRLKSDRPTERLAYFDPPSNPGSTVLVHKQPEDVWRIDYQVHDDEDTEQAVKPENVLPRVQSVLDSMGEKGDWSPIWITIYKANALTLERYRHARVLFAGDAAHLVPIFGVRGANSGIDDADNLAWKLAFVVNGIASDALLDNYSDERVFATHENLRYGMKSTEFMAPPSFAFELMRTAVLSLAKKHPEVRPLMNPRQTQAIAYVESDLSKIASMASAAFASGPVPGAAMPECRLTALRANRLEGIHLTDLVFPCFTALRFCSDESVDHAWERLQLQMDDAHIPFRSLIVLPSTDELKRVTSLCDHSGCLAEKLDAVPGTVYLLRPDGHVLARWREVGADTVGDVVLTSLMNNIASRHPGSDGEANHDRQ